MAQLPGPALSLMTAVLWTVDDSIKLEIRKFLARKAKEPISATIPEGGGYRSGHSACHVHMEPEGQEYPSANHRSKRWPPCKAGLPPHCSEVQRPAGTTQELQ